MPLSENRIEINNICQNEINDLEDVVIFFRGERYTLNQIMKVLADTAALLTTERKRLDWYLIDSQPSWIGGSEDLELAASAGIADSDNPEDTSDEHWYKHYLKACRGAIDAAIRKESECKSQ